MVTRLHPDGSLDAGFFPPECPGAKVTAALLQPDGKILLGLEYPYPPSALHSQPNYGSVLRLNADGSPDTTFRSDLIAETDARPAERVGPMVCALGLQADGRILVAGGFDFVNRMRRACVVRLLPDCTPDPSFETDIDYHPGYDDVEYITELAFAPEAKLLIGGYFGTSLDGLNGLVRAGLARLHLADDACAGVITLTTNLLVVNEDTGELAITMTRRGNLSQTVGVAYATSDYDNPTWADCARQGEDYLAQAGTLEFGPGESVKILRVPILDDWSGEANKEFYLTLSAPTGGAVLGYPGSGWLSSRILVLDNESAGQPGSLEGSLNMAFGFGRIGESVYGVEDFQTQPGGKILITGGFNAVDYPNSGSLARLQADGSPDLGFNPQIAGSVLAMLLEPDGQIVIGGEFTAVHGIPRTNLARLNADGSLDDSSMADPGWSVKRLARQPDGRLLVCGNRGDCEQPYYLRRLDAEGRWDTNFNDAVFHSSVRVILVQPDGKILVGGTFGKVNQTPLQSLARLNSDGSLDHSFHPFILGENHVVTVYALALQSDGKIVVGGSFSTLGGIPRSDVARLHPDGLLDATFDTSTQPRRTVYAFALQPDGKVVVGGFFGLYTTDPRNLARLNADGSLDTSFSAGSGVSGSEIRAVALLPDGDLLIGGGFATVNGLPRRFMARINGGVARPVLQPPARLANGGVRITAVGLEAGRPLALQASTNLLDWVTLNTPVATSNVFHFIDTTDFAPGQRFYRILREP